MPLTIRPLAPADEPALARVLESRDDFFNAATGSYALPADVQGLYYSLPEGADYAQKHLLVLCDGESPAGVVEAVEGHPEPSTCSVGLFLVAPWACGAGRATHAAEQLLEEAASRGMRRVTATCPADWAPGRLFLRSLGFTVRPLDGERTPTVGNRSRQPAEHHLLTAVRELPPPPASAGRAHGEGDGEEHVGS